MKRFVAIFIMALICSILGAKEFERKDTASVPGKSILSIDVGFTTDGRGTHGYSVFIKSSSFIGDGPVYYGFGSLFGSFMTSKETFFETGIFLGYNNLIGNSGLDFDVFLDFIATGGRIYQETAIYRAEAPALHMGLSLGLPASSDIDGTLTFAPVIRPYNLQTGEWDFSRCYFTAGLAVRFKSYMRVKKLPWSDSFGTTENKENDE